MVNKRYVYRFTFPNGMVYFGVTNDINKRWANNGDHYKSQPIGRYIRIYGWQNIHKEILYEGDGSLNCNEQCLNIERSLIELWGESCYNHNANSIHHPTKGRGLKWTIDDVTKTAVEWCREYSKEYCKVINRMNRHNLTPKQALTYPPVPASMRCKAKEYWQSLGLEVSI